MVILTAAYLLGIVLAKALSPPSGWLIVLFGAILLSSLVLILRKRKIASLLLLLFILLGGVNFQSRGAVEWKKPEPNRYLQIFTQKVERVLAEILPEKEGALLGSMLLGEAVAPLNNNLKEEFQKAGLIHLLVVSGTQVSIIIGVVLAAAKGLGFPLGLAVTITSLFNLLLVVVAGAGASILRAGIMGEIALIAMLFDRQNDPYNSLTLSALILLLFDPRYLFNIGFQLSFAATWALLYVVPLLQKKLPGLLALTIAPLMAVWPIIFYNFGQISLGGLLANLLVLPWLEYFVIIGFIGLVIGFIFLPLAKILAGTLWLAIIFLEKTAAFVASLPGSAFYVKPPGIIWLLAYYAALICFLEALRNGRQVKFSKQAMLILIFIVIWDRALSPQDLKRELRLSILDVGQGDCLLIESPGGKRVIVDGGGREGGLDSVGEKIVLPFLRRQGINRLDLAVLTHPHADHLNGLNTVLEKLKVDQVLYPDQAFQSAAYERFKALIARNRIKYHLARAGQRIELDPGIFLRVIGPRLPLLGEANSDSVVMQLVYGKVSFLLTGDLDFAGEEYLGDFPRCTVLKVGHHGSATSTSLELLASVRPAEAAISVGRRNKFRHPSRKTIKRLAERGIRVWRTDQQGTITFRTDGEKLLTCSKR